MKHNIEGNFCIECTSAAPPAISGSTSDYTSGPKAVDSVVTYTCSGMVILSMRYAVLHFEHAFD